MVYEDFFLLSDGHNNGAFPMTNPCISRLVLYSMKLNPIISTDIFVCCTFSISYYPILPSGKLTCTMWIMIILVGKSSYKRAMALWAMAYIAILVYQRVSPLILFSTLSDYPFVSSKNMCVKNHVKKQPFKDGIPLYYIPLL